MSEQKVKPKKIFENNDFIVFSTTDFTIDYSFKVYKKRMDDYHNNYVELITDKLQFDRHNTQLVQLLVTLLKEKEGEYNVRSKEEKTS